LTTCWGARRINGELLKLGFEVAQSTSNADIAQGRAYPADAKRPPVIVVSGLASSSGILQRQTLAYEDHDQVRRHLADFVNAYNSARRFKTLKASRLRSSSANPELLSPNHSS
jgi:hypothetical protein